MSYFTMRTIHRLSILHLAILHGLSIFATRGNATVTILQTTEHQFSPHTDLQRDYRRHPTCFYRTCAGQPLRTCTDTEQTETEQAIAGRPPCQGVTPRTQAGCLCLRMSASMAPTEGNTGQNGSSAEVAGAAAGAGFGSFAPA